jgi:hypothetical protein
VIVLLAVFLTNVFVLIYFIVNRGLVTDFSEPPNLFGLTINSPPNNLMRGSCGTGPEGRQYAIKWGVEMEGDHLYISDKDHNSHPLYGNVKGSARTESFLSFGDLFSRGRKWNRLPSQNEGLEMGTSTAYGGASEQIPEEEGDDGSTPPQPQHRDTNLSRVYSKISKRRSFL